MHQQQALQRQLQQRQQQRTHKNVRNATEQGYINDHMAPSYQTPFSPVAGDGEYLHTTPARGIPMGQMATLMSTWLHSMEFPSITWEIMGNTSTRHQLEECPRLTMNIMPMLTWVQKGEMSESHNISNGANGTQQTWRFPVDHRDFLSWIDILYDVKLWNSHQLRCTFFMFVTTARVMWCSKWSILYIMVWRFAYIRALLAFNSSYSLIQLSNSFSHQCAFKIFISCWNLNTE